MKLAPPPPITFYFWISNLLYHTTNKGQDNVQRLQGSFTVYADTNAGRVKGTQHNSRGKIPFQYFRGIPYAAPPLGKLRFEPPVPHPGWNRTWDATRYRSECIQITIFAPKEWYMGTEDCLYLNIATRKSYKKGDVPLLPFRPVVFWIHGGFFMEGSSNIYPPNYFMQEDIVFVTINYRLTSFGFLNSGDGTVAGNMGFKDQVMALTWVRDNIKYFNGDPNRVYVMGESAGGVSAHLHTLSPLSRGLFAGAVSMGGSALSPWSIVRDWEEQFFRLAHTLRCHSHTKNITRMVHCLKRLPAEKLAEYHHNVLNSAVEGHGSLFGPTIESSNLSGIPPFLTDRPLALMEQGYISETPWMHGVNSAEGAIYLIPVMTNETLRKLVNRHWHHYAPYLMMYRNHPLKHQISTQAHQYYLNGHSISKRTLKESIRMMSERGFYLDSHKAALLHGKVAPTYIYYNEYEGLITVSSLLFDKTSIPLIPNWMNHILGGSKAVVTTNFLQMKSKKRYGACHGDELPLLFPWFPLRKDVSKSDVDYEFSRKLIKLLVSFAANGVPNPFGIGEGVKWLPVNETNPNFEDVALKRLSLNKTFSIIDEPFFDSLQFWRNFNIT